MDLPIVRPVRCSLDGHPAFRRESLEAEDELVSVLGLGVVDWRFENSASVLSKSCNKD